MLRFLIVQKTHSKLMNRENDLHSGYQLDFVSFLTMLFIIGMRKTFANSLTDRLKCCGEKYTTLKEDYLIWEKRV